MAYVSSNLTARTLCEKLTRRKKMRSGQNTLEKENNDSDERPLCYACRKPKPKRRINSLFCSKTCENGDKKSNGWMCEIWNKPGLTNKM